MCVVGGRGSASTLMVARNSSDLAEPGNFSHGKTHFLRPSEEKLYSQILLIYPFLLYLLSLCCYHSDLYSRDTSVILNWDESSWNDR